MVAETTSAPELGSTSEAEQMYLITIAREAEAGNDGPIRLALIADALGVSVPSANEMVRKLDTRGLLSYEPYHGVQLSETGRRIADQVLRTRRLWATFLADHLGFSPTDADDQACHLEHATSPEAANRLAAFLGNPQAGPLGRPIPDATVATPPRPHLRLTDITVGTTAEIVSISATGHSLDFLTAEGLTVGSQLVVTAAGDTGYLVDLGGSLLHVGLSLAGNVAVRPARRPNEPD